MIQELLADRDSDAFSQAGIRGDQYSCSQGVMFGLGEQISGNHRWVCALIGDHQNLARTRKGIDADASINGLFRKGYVEIPRAADDINLRDTVCSEGHGGDRLGSTDAHHPTDAGEVRRSQHHWVDAPVRSGRRTDHNLLNARHPRWNGIHQDGAGVGGPSARHIKARPLNRSPAPS